MLGRNTTTLLAALLEQLEGTLLSDIAHSTQLLDGLLASSLLAAADDTTTLGLDQVLLVETTGSVLGTPVVNFGFRTDSLHLTTHLRIILASAVCTAGSTTC